MTVSASARYALLYTEYKPLSVREQHADNLVRRVPGATMSGKSSSMLDHISPEVRRFDHILLPEKDHVHVTHSVQEIRDYDNIFESVITADLLE